MNRSSRLVTAILFAGCPLLIAMGAGLSKITPSRFGLDRWTYIHADDSRVPTSKKKGSFGIAFADVNGDGKIDVASGAHFYRNPGGDLTRTPWPRVNLPVDPSSGNPVDAGLLFNVKGRGPARDIIAEALPDIIWLHTDDPNGEVWNAKVVAQMPPPRHGNGRTIKLAKITPAFTRPEILLSGGGGTYLLQVPEDPETGSWPIRKITTTENDEQKAIGLGDIDRDGFLDLVLPAGMKLPQVDWWRNPGNTSAAWTKRTIGTTVNMSKMIEVADVNHDGRLDVVATDSENVDSGLFWFEAPADPVAGKWIRHEIAKGFNGLDSLSVADMNGDGQPDIVVGETKDRLRLVIYENVDAGKSWQEHLVSDGRESHKGANAVDLDGDGDLDLVSIAYFGFKDLHVWRNDSGGPPRRSAVETQPTAPVPSLARVPPGQWGVVSAELVHGNWQVFLQNERLLIRIDQSGDKAGKSKITAFCAIVRGKPAMISDSIDSRHSPGPAPAFFMLTEAKVLEDGPARKTVQLNFGNGKRVQNVSIFPNSPVLEIEYLELNPNKHTVDLRIAGGSTIIYGAREWQQQRGWPDLYPNLKAPYLENVAGSYYRAEWGAGPLDYNGHMIVGRYDSQSGLGLGLVLPLEKLAWFKLVRADGLERMAKAAPYKAHYFGLTGGADDIISVGKQIADGKLP